MLKQNVGCECNRNKYEDRCEDACKNFLRALLFLLESNYLLIILNRGVTGEACLSAPLRQHSTTGFEKKLYHAGNDSLRAPWWTDNELSFLF